MKLDAQTVIALIIVAACAVYVFRFLRRSWSQKPASGCGGDCGCHGADKDDSSL